ncbi:MAG: hypothetical protein HS115_05820 [Spirochaetales bacterium]|nr:hypothetical protein [Spirochaetales bacterium]
MIRLSCLLLCSLTLSGCAGFRIQELSPGLLLRIPISFPDAYRTPTIQTTFNGRVATNFPFRPYPGSELVIMQDAAHNRLLGFAYSGELELLAAKKKSTDFKNRQLNFDISIPGFVTGFEDTYYIESMQPQPLKDTRPAYWIPGSSSPDAPADQRLPGSMAGKEFGGSLSRIYRIDDSKNVRELKLPDERFESILDLQAGAQDRLYVFHEITLKEGRKRLLSVFENGKWMEDINFEGFSAEETRNYVIHIEAIAPSFQSYLLTAVFRNKNDYAPAFRRVYRLLPAGSYEQITEEKDPGIFFFSAEEDGSFWLMEPSEDSSRILLRYFTAAGDYQSNRLIEFPGLRASWRETYSVQGRLFSTRLYRGYYELYEWK